ncbi:MAG TPA: ribose 5-phosphate isomerase B [Candidatus Ozemobacteraceae bacterium]|nr:ribose 5-phosphate isomerase B [Candidatus Ozemobacteraceae bacterium]
MKIYAGSDHAGLPLKHRLIQHLNKLGHEVVDLGTDSEASCDYSDYAHAVAEKVAAEADTLGLLTCGSGIGMSIAANRHHGVRAALCHNSLEASLARQHNNANVLVLGGRIIGDELAIDILNTFLKAAFEGGRHARRVDKIEHA